ncbi:MAG TPA: site-specific integrase [Isosphaeraceae bacterium]|nr:site-specific integrase [Isosphaeraceae bacterium]
MQEPWFRRQTWSWYVELDGGKQHRLGKHPSDAAPLKGKKGWNPPEEIRAEWHRVMREGGRVVGDRDPLLAVLFDDFLCFADRTTKPETRDWYRAFLQDFKDRFPALKAGQVTAAHVQEWVRAPRKRPWGDSTRRSAITVLKRALNWAAKCRRIPDNPIAHMARPPARRREKILTAEERVNLLDFYPEGDPFRDFLIALQESGARPGEIMRLTAADVDLADGTATLGEHKTRGKTGKSRVIYLTPRLSALLAERMRSHPTGPIFRNADGNPWNRQAVNCRFRRKRNRKRDPIDKGIVAYTYRHTYTTDALEKGVPVATVAELLGHESTQVIASNYSHLAEKKRHLKDAARKAVE